MTILRSALVYTLAGLTSGSSLASDNPLSAHTPKSIVRSAFKGIFTPQGVNASAIHRYFSPQYQQWTNGITLDYTQFQAHIQHLAEITQSVHIEFIALIEEGEQVFSEHQVTVRKKNGTTSVHQVLTHCIVQQQKIISCSELSKQLAGNSDDSALASETGNEVSQ